MTADQLGLAEGRPARSLPRIVPCPAGFVLRALAELLATPAKGLAPNPIASAMRGLGLLRWFAGDRRWEIMEARLR